MLSRRVLVNLALFALLGLLAAVWAVTNVLSINAITHPYFVAADFTNSPGLKTNFQVAYLGVKVGTISSVKLAPGQAVVKLRIDRAAKLPVGIRAAAARQSAVGEPYVALSPPPGYTGGGPYVKGGYVIPVSQTTTPLSYQDVFNAIGQLVQAVPPQDLHSLIHELAVGLDGRAGDIRQIIENSDSLTTTLADNAGAINQSINDLTTLTHTFAQHGGALGSSLDNLATISASLAQSRQNIDTLLTNTPDFLHQVSALLDASGANLGCVIDGLGTVATILGTPAHVADLSTVLSLSPSLLTHLARMDGIGSDGPYLQGTFNFNLIGPPPIKPAPVQKLPPVPVTPNCPGAGTVGATPAAGLGPGAGGQAPGGVGSAEVPHTRPIHPASGTASSTNRQVGGRHWPILLVAVLGLVLVAVLILRPWRYLTGAAGRRRSGPSGGSS